MSNKQRSFGGHQSISHVLVEDKFWLKKKYGGKNVEILEDLFLPSKKKNALILCSEVVYSL